MLTWFEVIGYTVLLESDIASGRHRPERSSYTDVVLLDRLRRALERINPNIPSEVIEEVVCQVTRTESSNLFANNHRFHKFLTDGVHVEYQIGQRTVRDKVWLIDTFNILKNDWLAVHRFTVVEGKNSHIPEVVIFVNGLPLAVMEWIYPRNGKVSFNKIFKQLQTYKNDIPTLFSYNEMLIISDGTQARVGTLTSDLEQFMPWHTIDGEDFPLQGMTELEVLIQGIFDKRRFLDLVMHFVEFEINGANITKKMTNRPFCTIRTKQVLDSPARSLSCLLPKPADVAGSPAAT